MTAITKFKDEYSFLSNFYLCSVQFDSVIYPSLEHAYVAAKTFDQEVRQLIKDIAKPGKAKRLGRFDAFPLRYDWCNNLRIEIMCKLIDEKFAEGSELAQQLIDTYPLELIEGNNHGDCFYGQCDGVGDNHLGKILMRRRSVLMGLDLPPYRIDNSIPLFIFYEGE